MLNRHQHCTSRSIATFASNVGLVESAVRELIDVGTQSGFNRVEQSKVQMQIDKLERVSAELGLNRVNSSFNQGTFDGLLTTDLRQIDAESHTTLGRMTFGKAAPQDLEVQLNDLVGKARTGLPDQFKGNFEGIPESYVVHAHFKILPRKEENALEEPVHGVMSMIGHYEVTGEDKPQRLAISFSKVRLRPADPAHQLDAWKHLLGPHNPDLRQEDGVLEIPFASPAKGFLDYLVMTEEWHVSRGNMGSVVVMKRKREG